MISLGIEINCENFFWILVKGGKTKENRINMYFSGVVFTSLFRQETLSRKEGKEKQHADTNSDKITID